MSVHGQPISSAPFYCDDENVAFPGDYLHYKVFPPFIIASAVAHGRNKNEGQDTKHRGVKGRRMRVYVVVQQQLVPGSR